MKNNNLIIFYHDESKDVYSFPLSTDEAGAFKQFKEMRPDVHGEDVKKYFYIKNDETSPDTYGHFYELSENLKLTMDLRAYIIDKKTQEIRARRDSFLNRLDLPFMLSLEEDNDELKNHIKDLKNFLRELPKNLKYNEIEEDGEIVRYSPFGNIFDIVLVEGGSGYKNPPKVTIDSPKGVLLGFKAEAVAFVKDEKVTRVKIINHGCAYDYIPDITIDPSEEGERAFALASPPQNTNLSQEDFIKNTSKYYS